MTAQNLAAVLWDMDGTLIDSEELWLRAELGMLDRYGIEMMESTRLRLIGSGLRDAAEHFRALGVPLSIDEIVNGWVGEVARGLAEDGPVWRPGARELLTALAGAGIPTALVTMSVRSLAEAVVALLSPGSFDVIIAGDEVEFEKPHPEPYLSGASALGVGIEQCIAFEDSPTGLRSAVASGAVAIGVPNLLPLDEAPSHAIWPTLLGRSVESLKQDFITLRSIEPSVVVAPAIGVAR